MVVDKAIDVMPVTVFNAFRFGLAALTLMPLWLVARKSAKQEMSFKARGLIITGFSLGLLLFLGFSLQTQGMLYQVRFYQGRFYQGRC